MKNVLDEIVEVSRNQLKKRMKHISVGNFASFSGFEKERVSLKKAIGDSGSVSIIAEVKKASPSQGIIRQDFNPLDIALRYEEAGASAISVLTDEPFFQGSLKFLEQISERISLPILRKDFLTDPYEILEARAYGADAVLLIATILSENQLSEMIAAARENAIEALVECYDEADMQKLNFKKIDIFGVNNRNLKTFEVDVHRGIDLLKKAPTGTVLVSESGLKTPEDLFALHEHGIHAALIGEYFMRQQNIEASLRSLIVNTQERISLKQ